MGTEVQVVETDDIDMEFVSQLPGVIYWNKGVWAKRLEPLRKHPGVWARVRIKGHASRDRTAREHRAAMASLASAMSKGALTMPPGIWRAASRNGDLYVCFCGERTQ